MPARKKTKVRRKKAGTVRRRTRSVTAARKAKPKTRRKLSAASQKSTVNSLMKSQLAIYKDPHTMVTTHPKIPDGKVPRSLGLANQSAGEMVAYAGADLAGQPSSAPGVMHILMYPGQNSGAIVWNSIASRSSAAGGVFNNALAVGENLSWRGSPDISFNGLNSSSGGTLGSSFEYASWRTVSQGMALGLLNPAETDDGWYETVRVTDTMDPDDYLIMNTNRSSINIYGTVCPQQKLINDLKDRELANNQTYKTGLLRNIHKEYFPIAPKLTRITTSCSKWTIRSLVVPTSSLPIQLVL